MTQSEVRRFWQEVMQANRACIAELHLVSDMAPREAYVALRMTKTEAAHIRGEATASLRAFRPLERALAGYYQVLLKGSKHKQFDWAMAVRANLEEVISLCRRGNVHSAYKQVELLMGVAPFDRIPSLTAGQQAWLVENGGKVTVLDLVGRFIDARNLGRAMVEAGSKDLVALLAKDLSSFTYEVFANEVSKDVALASVARLLHKVGRVAGYVLPDSVEALVAKDGPLVTVEDSLRFRLECANDKVRQLEEENRELRALLKLKGEQ